MSIIIKITTGFVTQRFDTDTGEWLDQEFTAGDQVDYEDVYGGDADEDELEGSYLAFEMVQPDEHGSEKHPNLVRKEQ
jgi:hypothetical protein